jgi:hypothetical protein
MPMVSVLAFWVEHLVDLKAETSVSDKYTVSIFRSECGFLSKRYVRLLLSMGY